MEKIKDEIIEKITASMKEQEARSEERFDRFESKLKALEVTVTNKLAARVDSAVKTSREADASSKAVAAKVDEHVDISLRSCRLKLDGVPKSCNPDRVIEKLTAMLGYESRQVLSWYKLGQIADRPPTIVLQFPSDPVKSHFIDSYYRKALKENDIRKLYGTDKKA
jgi:hypothetical protein